MSDLMLLGVLRMPVTPQSDELTLRQYINCGRQAADLIERQQVKINELAATFERLQKACELALNNYGRMLMSYPPQCAWKSNQVTEKLVEAIASTPRQNLNAVKRDVAREAFISGATDAAAFISQQLSLGKTDIDLDAGTAADKYIQRIKDGE